MAIFYGKSKTWNFRIFWNQTWPVLFTSFLNIFLLLLLTKWNNKIIDFSNRKLALFNSILQQLHTTLRLTSIIVVALFVATQCRYTQLRGLKQRQRRIVLLEKFSYSSITYTSGRNRKQRSRAGIVAVQDLQDVALRGGHFSISVERSMNSVHPCS